ncbi:hypothetical protein COOONC_06042, partial [Cooperia oncophora]
LFNESFSAFIRSILGFILFSTSYCIVNTGIYYKFVRPLRQEERELLERELIEADRAGFKMSFSHIMSSLVSRWEGLFFLGFTSGAGFELFKIYFSFRAFIRSILGFILFSTSYCIVNTGIYYKFVRPLRQEERELLERELIEADRAGFKVNLK